MKRIIFPVEMSKTWVTTGDRTYCDVKYQLAFRDKTMRELMKVLSDDTELLNFYSCAVGATRRCAADVDNIEIARNISNDKAKMRMERALRSRFYKMRDLLIEYSSMFHEAAEAADDAIHYHQKRRTRMMEKPEKEAEEKLNKAREAVKEAAEKVKAEKEGELAEAAKIVEALKAGKANEIVRAVNEYCAVTDSAVAGTVLNEILNCIVRATEKAKAEAEAAAEAERLEKAKYGIGEDEDAKDPVWDGIMDEIFNAMLELEKVKNNIKEGKDNAR